jgi:outer membrane protein assembly factor BamB
MGSKMASIFIGLIMIMAIFPQIAQNVEQSSPSLTLSSSSGPADSPWPMFRQNLKHTGLSPYDTSANPGNLKWSFTTGSWVSSSPAIGSDNIIYVGSEDNNLYAINSLDGSKKWSFTTGAGVRSSPSIDSNGTIYVGSNDARLYAINSDGTEKWSFMTGYSIYSSPAISFGGTIYVGSNDYKLYAINPDGTEKWNFTTGDQISSSPAISSDDTIYIGSDDYKLYAIDPNGIEKWSFMTYNLVRSSPSIDSNGTIYVGSNDGKLYAINPDGTEKWNFTIGEHIGRSSPAIGSDGTIYVGSFDNNIYAINPDGTEKWIFTTGHDTTESSPAIGSDGTIYVGSYDNNLYAINPDGTEKWNYSTGMHLVSSPAIGIDGTIYVGSIDGKLYAIGTLLKNQPPIADAGPDQTINEGEQAIFNISGSYDPDGYIVRYDIDFGDGTNFSWEPSTTTVTGEEILVYATRTFGVYNHTFFDEDLPRVLIEEGFNPVISGPDHIDELISDILADYDQLWILSTNFSFRGIFSQSEIDSILGFQTEGGGVLIMADHVNRDLDMAVDANQISTNYGVTFSGIVDHGHSVIDPFIVDHPINEDVDTIWGHWSEADLTITNPNVEVIAIHSGYEMIAVMDVEDEGRMVFDTSFTRMEDGDDPNGHHILQGDNVQYAKNIAKWLGEGFGSETPPLINHTYGDDGLGTDGIYTVTLTVTDNDGNTANDTCVVTVNNVIPTIDSFGPFTVREGESVTLSTNAQDQGSDDLIFAWTFEGGPTIVNSYYNDGVGSDPYPSPFGTFPFSATDIVNHTYGDDGVYGVSLIVSDDDGGTAIYNTTVIVNNVPPGHTVPAISGYGDEGSPARGMIADAIDPGSDDLIIEWDFGDGTSETNVYYNDGTSPEPVYDPSTNEIKSPRGVFPFSFSDESHHIYGDNGVYHVLIIISDDDGGATTFWSPDAIIDNVPPVLSVNIPLTVDEGEDVLLRADAKDNGTDDLTFTWDLGDGTPSITGTYFNNDPLNTSDPYPSPWGTYPFNASDSVSHVYGDNGIYQVTLTVEDDDGGTITYFRNITVNNVAPTIEPMVPIIVEEGSPFELTAISTDPGSDDLTFTWDFEYGPTITTTYYNDGSGPDPYPSPGGTYPFLVSDLVSHTYGDNGVFMVRLIVEDDDGGSTTQITNITVNNVTPIIENIEAYMHVNFTLRVAGEKYHSVNITLYEDDAQIWCAGVTRQPGSPDEQAATLSDYSINFGSSYRAVVDYLPNDPRVNGNVWGGSPVWIILEFQDGTFERVHHTFNVRQSDWDSDHWNHIDPWEVDLASLIYRHNITFEATASDLGSDDLIFDWDFGDGGTVGPNTYFNDGVHPDPYPSPNVNPINVTDTVMYAYSLSGNYTVTLTVTDDDGGAEAATLIIMIPG